MYSGVLYEYNLDTLHPTCWHSYVTYEATVKCQTHNSESLWKQQVIWVFSPLLIYIVCILRPKSTTNKT